MKLGFIGCGNMAGAIMGGIINHNVCKKEEIIGSDPQEAGRKRVQENHGIKVTADNKEVVKEADIVFLAVKPQYYESVLDEIKGMVREGQIFVSIAPGKTLA